VVSFTLLTLCSLYPYTASIQWVPGALSSGVKQPGSETDHSPTSSAKVKMHGAVLHSPTRLHGVVLG
jgi:hypothetical protein